MPNWNHAYLFGKAWPACRFDIGRHDRRRSKESRFTLGEPIATQCMLSRHLVSSQKVMHWRFGKVSLDYAKSFGITYSGWMFLLSKRRNKNHGHETQRAILKGPCRR